MVDFLKRKFPAYVDTGLNLVDVTECARGTWLLWKREQGASAISWAVKT